MNALFTLAAYNLEQDNVLTPDPLNALYSVQTGKVRTRGVEFSIVASPLPGLNLRVAATHMESEVLQSNVAGVQGRQLTNTPQDLLALWASYTMQDGALCGLTLGGGVRYVGSAYANVTNTITMPSYTTVDALVGYDLGALSPRMEGLPSSPAGIGAPS